MAINIKVYSSLCVQAYIDKQCGAYCMWLLAREYSNGTGKFTASQAFQWFNVVFKASKKTVYNYLEQGESRFWTKSKQHYYLKSLEKVAETIDVPFKFNTTFLVEVNDLCDLGITVRDFCVSMAVCADRFRRPLSASYMSKLLKCDRTTLSRHIHPALVTKKTNYRNGLEHWNSYIFNAGKILALKKEKRCLRAARQMTYREIKRFHLR